MTPDPLVARLTEALVAAEHRWRRTAGMGVFLAPRIPAAAIDHFAAALIPVIRQAVADAREEGS